MYIVTVLLYNIESVSYSEKSHFDPRLITQIYGIGEYLVADPRHSIFILVTPSGSLIKNTKLLSYTYISDMRFYTVEYSLSPIPPQLVSVRGPYTINADIALCFTILEGSSEFET